VLHAKKLPTEELGASADENASITKSTLSRMACDNNERYARIEQQAYELAQTRGFMPGHELDDWLAAEAMIDEQLLSESRVF
jgi:hypothetical protein